MFNQYVVDMIAKKIEPGYRLWLFSEKIDDLTYSITHNDKTISTLLFRRIDYLDIDEPTEEDKQNFKRSDDLINSLTAENRNLHDCINLMHDYIDNIKADQDMPPPRPVVPEEKEDVVSEAIREKCKLFP